MEDTSFMDDASFKQLFQRIVDKYELPPDVASELLQRILTVLKSKEDKAFQYNSNYNIFTEHTGKGEIL